MLELIKRIKDARREGQVWAARLPRVLFTETGLGGGTGSQEGERCLYFGHITLDVFRDKQ